VGRCDAPAFIVAIHPNQFYGCRSAIDRIPKLNRNDSVLLIGTEFCVAPSRTGRKLDFQELRGLVYDAQARELIGMI
jgi:hypothetical protein